MPAPEGLSLDLFIQREAGFISLSILLLVIFTLLGHPVYGLSFGAVFSDGCTSFLPTLITSPDEKIEKALNLMKEMKDKEEIGVLGLHIEGPYISVEKKGIHRPEYIRILSDEMVEKIANAGPEATKIITIAPEKAKVEHLEILKKQGLISLWGIRMQRIRNVWKRKTILTVLRICIMP